MEAAASDPGVLDISPLRAGEPSEIQALTLLVTEIVTRVQPPPRSAVWPPNLCQLLTAPGIHTASEQEQTSALRSQLDGLDVLCMPIFCPAHYAMLRIQLPSPHSTSGGVVWQFA